MLNTNSSIKYTEVTGDDGIFDTDLPDGVFVTGMWVFRDGYFTTFVRDLYVFRPNYVILDVFDHTEILVINSWEYILKKIKVYVSINGLAEKMYFTNQDGIAKVPNIHFGDDIDIRLPITRTKVETAWRERMDQFNQLIGVPRLSKDRNEIGVVWNHLIDHVDFLVGVFNYTELNCTISPGNTICGPHKMNGYEENGRIGESVRIHHAHLKHNQGERFMLVVHTTEPLPPYSDIRLVAHQKDSSLITYDQVHMDRIEPSTRYYVIGCVDAETSLDGYRRIGVAFDEDPMNYNTLRQLGCTL